MAEKKKKKSRIKKFLKAAAKAALIGGAAYGATKLFGGKKKFGTDAGFLKSGAAGGASLSTPPIHGTDHIPKVTHPAAVDTAADTAGNTGSVYLSRMKGNNPDDPTGETGQKVRANWAQNKRYVNPNEQTLAAGNAYVPRIPRVHKRGVGLRMKSGGRVTGIAKRGFGRALMKGKK